MMYILVVVIVILIAIGYVVKSTTKPANYPPGPKWYPFIGSSGVVQKMTEKHGSQWKGLSSLAREYSTQVLGLKLGSELLVIVYGEKNVRQVFTGLEFEGRPDTFFLRLRCFGKRMGITFSDGPLWRQHRQFTVKQLRHVGFGKTEMEKEIQCEMLNILQLLKDSLGKPFNPKNALATAVMNILWKFVAGEKINEEQLKYLLDLLNARSKAFSMAGGWLNQAPWSRFIFPTRSGFKLIKDMNQQISDIIEDAIEKHKRKQVQGNDFIYSYIEEMDKTKNSFTEEQLKVICLDLLIAGSQTTSNVLEFAILVLLKNKTIQERIFQEIKQQIGDRTPSWNDNSRLIYTSAFINEVQRFYTIVPLAGPRRVLEDTTIDGYSIPKETTLLLSIGDVHFSPDIWDDPHEFKPDRFIDEHGLLKNVEHIYPFGLGRRRCPGDALAKSFIFILIVGILQNFKIECCNGVLPPDEPNIGLISSPKYYEALFVLRN